MSRLLDLPLMSLFKVSKRTRLCLYVERVETLPGRGQVQGHRVRFGDKE